MPTAIKHFYLDDAKLKQRAWLEFTRAMRTDRMIAFVGSMATEPFGYGSWDKLRKAFGNLAKEIVRDGLGPGEPDAIGSARMAGAPTASGRATLDDDQNWAIRTIDVFSQAGASGKLPATIAMNLVEEVLSASRITRRGLNPLFDASKRKKDQWSLDLPLTPQEMLSSLFARRYRRRSKPIPSMDVPKLLFDVLDIRRFATTNYDFELERKTMLRDQEPRREGVRLSVFEQLRGLRQAPATADTSEIFNWDLGSAASVAC